MPHIRPKGGTPINITVDLSSFDAEAAIEQIRRGMERGVDDACELVKAEAQQNMKGDARGKHLMSSIQTQVTASGDRVEGQIGVGGATGIDGEAGENFGIYVHEGTGIKSRTGMGRKDVPWFYMDAQGEGHITSGMEANPFLENAYNALAGQIAQIIADAITS